MLATTPKSRPSEASLALHRKKLVIVGDSVGKTSLLLVQSGERFKEEYIPTIFENYVSRVDIGKRRVVELSLWDTAGQEEYDRLRPLSYPDTDVVLLTFAFDNRVSFDAILEKWYPETHHFLPDVPIILVGTKRDLKEDAHALQELARRSLTMVTTEDAMALKEEIGAVKYFEVSAKTEEGVAELFTSAARIAYKWNRQSRRCSVQ